MEHLTRLNNHIDTLISTLRNAQDETAQLRSALEESRTAGIEKDDRIRALEIAGTEKDQRILAQDEAMAKKDVQLEELIARIEQVLSALPKSNEAVEPPPVEQIYQAPIEPSGSTYY